ncbi:hypothetical protein, partial [Haemophilus parainfluenzae]|uniref:hypothetical protein n=1 Tax=Haemophilus parainfluenzae TaxID=729 RepID=UPI001CED64FB
MDVEEKSPERTPPEAQFEAQLSALTARLDAIEARLGQITPAGSSPADLSTRVAQIEETITLITDV